MSRFTRLLFTLPFVALLFTSCQDGREGMERRPGPATLNCTQSVSYAVSVSGPVTLTVGSDAAGQAQLQDQVYKEVRENQASLVCSDANCPTKTYTIYDLVNTITPAGAVSGAVSQRVFNVTKSYTVEVRCTRETPRGRIKSANGSTRPFNTMITNPDFTLDPQCGVLYEANNNGVGVYQATQEQDADRCPRALADAYAKAYKKITDFTEVLPACPVTCTRRALLVWYKELPCQAPVSVNATRFDTTQQVQFFLKVLCLAAGETVTF